jgi:hypothetical protein
MLKSPKLVVVYIFALGGAQGYREKAAQFVDTYHKNPPGLNHDTVVVCNGVPANEQATELFSSLPNMSFLDRDDSGWDIGGFQDTAKAVTADLMLFCGGHTYFRKPGWLERIMDVYTHFGPALYGSTGNQGDLRVNVHPHVRTTGFWCPSALMAEYPHKVTHSAQGGGRYEFEHGKTCLSNWTRSIGLKRLIVGWNEVLTLETCDSMSEGFHKGSQSNVLIGDRLTQKPYGCD